MKLRRTSETPRSFSLCGHRPLREKTFSLSHSRKIRGTAGLGNDSSVVHQVVNFSPDFTPQSALPEYRKI